MIIFMNFKEKIFFVGRLDKDLYGFILFINDGSIVNKILRVENGYDKEYYVILNKFYDDYFIEIMIFGVEIYNLVVYEK